LPRTLRRCDPAHFSFIPVYKQLCATLQYWLTTNWADFHRPFFLGVCFCILKELTGRMALQETIEQTVAGLGYALVDVERTGGGLLRVTIDWPYAPGTEQFVNAEDCEKVTRQLQFVLEVEGVDYSRLEVSSPGIDRPLRTEQDFARFAGQLVDITLKTPIGTAASAGSTVSANRKKFRGVLERIAGDGIEKEVPRWQIVWRDEPAVKPGQKVSKKKTPAPQQALGFTLDEIAQARLAPVVDFKGRRAKTTPAQGQAADE
jgi:ribosome maturation factor RimP